MTATERGHSSEEYLTIAEYAQKRGVSTAAVYKRLDKRLKPWVVVIDGKKHLLASVLYEEQAQRDINHSTKKSRKIVNDNPETPSTELIAALREQIVFLRAEVESQRDAIREKDRQLVDFGARFAELAARNAELVDQAHRLNAADKPRLIAEQSAEAEAPTTPAATVEHGEAQQQAEATPQGGGTGEDKPRRGFWARLFGLD